MDWHNWCRLCGNIETLLIADNTALDIAQKLELGNHETKICIDCSNYLLEIHQFAQTSKSLQLMFLELEGVANEEEEDSKIQQTFECETINELRSRYGLKICEVEGLDNLFDESNIAGVLEVKIENENCMQVLEEGEFIDEDEIEGDNFIESSELKGDDEMGVLKFEEEDDEDYRCDEEFESDEQDEEDVDEDIDELITEEMNQRAKKRKKIDQEDDDVVFDFVCHICKQEFTKMTTLAAHCRKIHDCLPEVMCYCGKTLSTWKRLLVHKQKHFPEKFQYECEECRMVYKLKTSYLNHLKTKHGPDAKKFICTQCSKCFKDTRTLAAHEKTHLPDELKLLHPCSICDKRFVNKNSLKSHVASVHENLNLFTCETCGKSFSTKSNLKSHLYSHSNEKNVQCDICSVCFKNMDSLRKHKKTHLEKSFQCEICQKRYRNRNNLKAHMVCHSDQKPFQCSFCSNQYKRSKDLKSHLNLHTGERPHVCPFCNRSFINGSNCRKHKLKDHPEELAAFEAQFGKGKAAAYALQTLKPS